MGVILKYTTTLFEKWVIIYKFFSLQFPNKGACFLMHKFNKLLQDKSKGVEQKVCDRKPL